MLSRRRIHFVWILHLQLNILTPCAKKVYILLDIHDPRKTFDKETEGEFGDITEPLIP